MPSPYIVITAANEKYRPLLLDLLNSLQKQRGALPFDIGVLDVGMSAATQQEIAASYGAIVKPAEADIEYPGRIKWEAEAFYYRTLTARPYLPRYFPGYQAYMWIDADAWVQTAEAMLVMLKGAASEPAIYMVPELDRDYLPSSQHRLMQSVTWCKSFYGDDIANQMMGLPTLNAGVFAMRADCPVWEAWGALLTHSLRRYPEITRSHFMMDQVALNIAIFAGKYPLRPMPTEFNWLPILSIPVFDEATHDFWRPTPPRHAPISIIHLADDHKDGPMDFLTTTGEKRRRPLTFAATAAARDGAA